MNNAEPFTGSVNVRREPPVFGHDSGRLSFVSPSNALEALQFLWSLICDNKNVLPVSVITNPVIINHDLYFKPFYFLPVTSGSTNLSITC